MPQTGSGDKIALREFQQSLKCVITWLETMGYLFSLNSTTLQKQLKDYQIFFRIHFKNTVIQ